MESGLNERVFAALQQTAAFIANAWRASAVTTFRATPDDFAGLVRENERKTLQTSLPFPVGALMVGLCLLPANRLLGAFALGAAAAWAWSTIQELRAVRPMTLWTHAWLQEDVTVTTETEGLRIQSIHGMSFLRWDGGIRVLSRADFFVIKDEEDDVALLPKKYLTETELLVLNTQASKQP